MKLHEEWSGGGGGSNVRRVCCDVTVCPLNVTCLITWCTSVLYMSVLTNVPILIFVLSLFNLHHRQ